MRRFYGSIVVALLLISMVGVVQAQSLTVAGWMSPPRVYVSATDPSVHLKVLYSNINETVGVIEKQRGAFYLGWYNPLPGVNGEWSIGAVVVVESEKQGGKVLSHDQTLGLRADVTLRVASGVLSFGLSGAGVDYSGGIDLLRIGAFSLFAGYSSWPNHQGPMIGVSTRW